MPAASVTFGPVGSDNNVYLVLGEKDVLLASFTTVAKCLPFVQQAVLENHLKPLQEPIGASDVAFYPLLSFGGKSTRVILATLSSERQRNTGTIRSDLIAESVAKYAPKEGSYGVLLLVKDQDQVYPAAVNAARAFYLYNQKSEKKETGLAVKIELISSTPIQVDYKLYQTVTDAIRQCANYVDMPASELHTDSYLEEIKRIASSLKVELKVIRGEELEKAGFGGLWGVGKAGPFPPALAILSYKPPNAKKTVAFVGKGIVFDTGGLSIKGGANMCSMKTDMGGSAAILCAFEAAVKLGVSHTLHALLCLAENSVDSKSTRPDDILYMYSGKSVEVNNTDAEGRLVLADGVAYATRHLSPDIVVDMATLTGAQLVTTGQKHAAILCNDEAFEKVAVQAGRLSGDWVYPILYAPELLKSEFKSEVADMKNSVKNRMNAQCSCAGHFIEDHLEKDWKGTWLHVDIAGPASTSSNRGTGFGVAFLQQLLTLIQ